MPRGKRPRHTEPSDLAALFRGLADRAAADPAFAAELVKAAERADVPSATSGGKTPATPARGKAGAADTPPSTPAGAHDELDPFRVLREHGLEELTAQLRALDVAVLRRVVRHHRLDPARISARWTNRDKLVQLIVSQVRARQRRGHAFERI